MFGFLSVFFAGQGDFDSNNRLLFKAKLTKFGNKCASDLCAGTVKRELCGVALTKYDGKPPKYGSFVVCVGTL
ncbi:MAG: hypothetical protein LBR74_05785 [Eubacterium sp.]|nr:hypothetical protein [Eubacterium sp.]